MNRLLLLLALLVIGIGFPSRGDAEVKRTISTDLYAICWRVKSLTYEVSGYVTLKFVESTRIKKRLCPNNIIYDIHTVPKGQIRGSKGIHGRNPEKVFYIQVTPKTKEIYLKVLMD